jgi:hypothetical protein
MRSLQKHSMMQSGMPAILWEYGLIYQAQIMSQIAQGPNARPGLKRVLGNSVDISEWSDFTFYQLVWFWKAPNLNNNPAIGWWIGVSHQVGHTLCYWVFTQQGNIMAQSTVQHIPDSDHVLPTVQKCIHVFNTTVTVVLGSPKCHNAGDPLSITFNVAD